MIAEPGEIAVVERRGLQPGPGEVVARPVHVGVCGTDLELLRGEVDPAFVRYPLTIGHEWSGVVESVGPGVTGLAPGDRVVAEGIVPCGICAACRRGATNVCEIYEEVGFTREGAASDQIALPARLIHRLAADVPLLDAALVEPAAVVYQGLSKVALRRGDEVLIIGDGTIALLAAQLALLQAPARVVVRGLRPEQAPLVAAYGTEFSTVEPTDRFDVVIEAAGSIDAVLEGLRCVRRGGRMLLLGYAGAQARVPLPLDDIVNADLVIASSFGYTVAAWAGVVALLNGGRFRPGGIVTHRLGLAGYRDAFEALARPEGIRGKIVLDIEPARQ